MQQVLDSALAHTSCGVVPTSGPPSFHGLFWIISAVHGFVSQPSSASLSQSEFTALGRGLGEPGSTSCVAPGKAIQREVITVSLVGWLEEGEEPVTVSFQESTKGDRWARAIQVHCDRLELTCQRLRYSLQLNLKGKQRKG